MSVLVFVENWDGKFKKLSFELVSYATKVAEMLGTGAIAVSIGKVEDTELAKLAGYGASKIISLHLTACDIKQFPPVLHIIAIL